MVKQLIDFFKNPVFQEDENIDLIYRFSNMIQLLGLSLLISITIALLIGLLESAAGLELGTHAVDKLFEEYGAGFIFLAVVILAPLLEELLFRGPLYLFRNSRYFGFMFYFLTIIFGFYHITNFELNPTIFYLSPLLVAPQLFIGLLLGFIRVRFGLIWSIMLHSLYNLILIGPPLALKLLDIELS